MKNFSELSLSAHLKSNLAKHGFTEPTPIQALSIEPALAGRDLVATAQTGTGQNAGLRAAYDPPARMKPKTKGVRAVVLSPTRELAIQINETFVKMAAGTGLRAAVVVGGVGEHPQLQAIRKGAQVVIATPGRLYDFISRNLVNLSTASACWCWTKPTACSTWASCPPSSASWAPCRPQRQTLFFSATIETSVKHLVEVHVPDAVRVEIGSTTKPVDEVELHLYEVEGESKLGLLQKMLREEPAPSWSSPAPSMAPTNSPASLSPEFKVAAIHGDRSQNQRNQALKGFQDGYYRVLVATDVAARGIHVEGISHVVNYDLPQVPEDFIHRVGRTGRAGARGTASTFSTRMERSEIARIEKVIGRKMERRAVPGLAEIVEIKPAAPKYLFKSRAPRRRRAM